ncbi:4'-phosphopantetheinyl transferase family protein [Massilia sp. DWR3-1-1]|uniref:4'-phosphopantetheinyl transferase family protein n=1 Tax=Massilia sp. DWR3-1-1 TaxID=2804559 RepID=UPI003CEFA104
MKALPVLHWPGAAGTPAPAWHDDLLVLMTTIPAGADARPASVRARARADIRAAACEVAALLTGVGAERLEVAGAPGSAPRLLFDGADSGIGMSISHAAKFSLAALHRTGAVGLDVMQIGLASDWARVAHDYLGMATASLLAAADAPARPLAFCRAWVRREAALKLRGEALTEWTHDPRAVRFIELALGEAVVGVLAID